MLSTNTCVLLLGVYYGHMNEIKKLTNRLVKRFGSEKAVAAQAGTSQQQINRLRRGLTKNPGYALVMRLKALDEDAA